MRLFKSLCLLIALCACGGNYKNASFGSQTVRVLDGDLTISGGTIQGTGSVVFGSGYQEFKSAGSYSIDFSLEDGGSVVLISHSNDALANGFEVEFSREGNALKVNLRAQGRIWSGTNNFNGIIASGPLKFQLDVHNNESPSHVIVWNRALGENFSLPAAILNSAEEIDGSPGIGTGIYWGLSINKATVRQAELGDPKFSH